MAVRGLFSPSLKVQRKVWPASLTKQSMAADTNINNIMKKYRDTSTLVHVSTNLPRYGDFTNAVDYQSSLNLINQAQELFQSLPSDVRKRFANSPAQLMSFLSQESNRAEAIKLGLVVSPTPSPAAVSGVVSTPIGGATTVPPVTT